MRAARRRQRSPDSLAAPAAVRAVCARLGERLPDIIPKRDKELLRFLYAVRHIERHPASETRRGRPSRWKREDLLKSAGELRAILQRETSGRVSLSSFVGQYLPILSFPIDVTEALSAGEINLQEAAQLARLIPERLNCTPAQARSVRSEVLRAHVTSQGSQNALRARVKEILGEVTEVTSAGMGEVVQRVDELLEIDPSDKRHMFWEEMKRLFFAMREVEPEDLNDEIMSDFLSAMDGVSNVLFRIEKRRRERQK